MKKYLCITILLAGITLLIAQELTVEPPYQALKLLGDSTAEGCPACAADMQKRAFKIINSQFPAGRTIEISRGITLVRSRDCADGELLLSSYLERRVLREDQDRGKVYAPLLTFFFHTSRHHLAGTGEEYRTQDDIEKTYGGPEEHSIRYFTGRLEIIPCNYCDGTTSLFFQRQNRLQIQCRILELRSVDSQ
ncbi:MAG: hypothetical protein JXA20_02205 [Spirochaetes bacterium]|nr:hypothetical protein [Spirochaetota bacterium]